jgi:hypothetical protein
MDELRRLVVTVVMVAVAPVHADPVDDQVARGEELGRQGSWTQAIDHFKAADRIAPRARHACLIGLAYARRELWAEAELFFAACHRRSAPGDPLPEWLPEAETQLAQKLAVSNAAAITIVIDPPEAAPKISVSSFAPDETFAPGTFHLAPGTHVIDVEAPGFDPGQRKIYISDATPQLIRIALHEPRERSRVPWIIIGTGVAIGLGGLAYDHFVLQPTRDLSTSAIYQWQYEQAKVDFPTQQHIALGLFTTAAVVTTIGVVLRYTVYRHRDREPVRVGALLARGTTGIAIEWAP